MNGASTRRILACAAVVLCSLIIDAAGQAQANRADLNGVVRDATGGVLPGTEVQATHTSTGQNRHTVTDDTGTYQLPSLTPGSWELRVSLPGFKVQVIRGIVLTVGQFATVDVQLDVLTETSTEVIVMGNAEIVERERTVQSSTIEEVQIDNLPINGRNYLDFTLLTPGVTEDNSLLLFSSPATPTSGLSFAGQDQRSNYVTIDGADNIDIISNTVRSTMSQEAIQEFQISRNTFSAEFGRARGGTLNIVSKSGGNQFHGSGFFFFRNNGLDARNTFARQGKDPDFRRYEGGVAVGGPISRDRTFFFASYERLDRDETLFVSFLDDPTIFQATPSQAELFGFLGATGVPELQFLANAFINPSTGALNTTKLTFPSTLSLLESESGDFPFSADQDVVSFKLDHQFSDNNNFLFRFNLGDSFNDGVQFGALQGVSNGVSFDTRDYSFVVADTHIFSPQKLNEIRFQFARREFTVLTNDPEGPEFSIAGVAQLGREFFNPSSYDENIFQVADNFTIIKGRHSLKMGVDLNVMDLKGFAEVFLGGQFSFSEVVPLSAILDNQLGPGFSDSLKLLLGAPPELGGLGRPDLVSNVSDPLASIQAFNFGLPATYFQGFGNPNTELNYPQLGFYLQDNWRATDRLTINLGLRYDIDWRADTLNVTGSQSVPCPPTLPPSIPCRAWDFDFKPTKDRNNFGPRVGFAWDALGNSRLVVRGGGGVYYQNFFQATAFVSQVLSGAISQVFLPLSGLPGTDVTSATVWGAFQQTGRLDEDLLRSLGIAPGTTPSVILPSAADVPNPYSLQSSLGIETRLANDWALAVDYIMNRGLKITRGRDINFRQIGPNRFTLPGIDPRFIQVNIVETSGSSKYHGFTLALRKRFSDNYALNVSYTGGKATDDTTDFISQYHPNNQANIRSERSLSSFDQRHRFVVNAVLQSSYTMGGGQSFGRNLLADWTLSPIVTWGSGRPFNLLTGFDLNEDTHEETDRPVLANGSIAGRNTGRGPAFFTTNLRLARRFNLAREETSFEFIFEAFNLFNNVNYSGVNSVIGTLELADPRVEGSENIPANRPLGFTSAFDPRQIQFGFRLNF